MAFDCLKFHHRCKADCCGCVPFEKTWWESHKHCRIVRPIVEARVTSRHIVAITKDLKCCFLKGCLCSVHTDRPWICQKYGDESTVMMSCPYQDKNGRPRSNSKRKWFCKHAKIAAQKVFDKLKK